MAIQVKTCKPGEGITLFAKHHFAAAMDVVAERLGVSVDVIRARLARHDPATVVLMFAVFVEIKQRSRHADR